MNKLVANEHILALLLKDMNFKDFVAITHDVVTKLEHMRYKQSVPIKRSIMDLANKNYSTKSKK